MNAKEKLTKARTRLILDSRGGFYGNLAMKLSLQEDNKKVKCAQVNEKNIMYYNSEFIDELTVEEATFLMAHEVLHLALLHPWRTGSRNQEVFQLACDFIVNRILVKAGFRAPDQTVLCREWDNLSEEEVYKEIMKNLPPQKQKSPGKNEQDNNQDSGSGGGSSNPDDKKDNENKNKNSQGDSKGNKKDEKESNDNFGGFEKASSTSESKESETDWKLTTEALAKMSQGKLGSELERLLASIIDPEIDWIEYVRDFLDRTARNDYYWGKTNKRYLAQGIIQPTLISEELPEVLFINDTSGSRDQQQMDEVAGGISSILEQFNTTVRVIHTDAQVYGDKGEQIFTKDDLPIKLHPVGGGGTDFRPVFNHIKEKGYEPCCIMYFTDLWGTFPEYPPEIPVLWISPTKDKKAPWGETVHYNQK